MFWSVIAANRRKTVLLIVLMGLLLVLSGGMIGMAFTDVYHPFAGLIGAALAGAVWIAMLLMSLFASDTILLGLSRAHEVSRETYPQLFNVVEEMVIAGALPGMPRIFVVDDPAPNAFAMGKSPEKSCICVTAGLLAMCTRDELQGVVAHEISHILNQDVLYMTVAATMLGSILLLSDIFTRSFRYTSTVRLASRSRRAGGRAAGPLLIVSLVLAVIGPILARVLYFSLSRKREYLADATSARLTRYPEGLASALQKIGESADTLTTAPSATAPFYIVNPYRQHLGNSAFATHPPLEERIRILRAMSLGAGYLDYHRAYVEVTRRREKLFPASELQDVGRVGIREDGQTSAPVRPARTESARRAGDIIRALNGFAFITCPCGLKIKLPPEYREARFVCPRCRRAHLVNRPDGKAVCSVLSGSAVMSRQASAGRAEPLNRSGRGGRDAPMPQEVCYQPGAWQKITCAGCGHEYEISPRFRARRMVCSGCGATIRLAPVHEPDDRSSGIQT
ncbi:MAG: M48 family metallopeptidase [Desulfomonilia bacterium]